MVRPPVFIRHGEISPTNVSQIQQRRTFAPHNGAIYDVAFNQSGDTLALACEDHVELFQTDTGNSLGVINLGSGAATGVCFHPHGQQLAVCGGNAARFTIWDVASRALVQEVTKLLPGSANCYQPDAVAFSRTGNTLITNGFDNRVVLWDWSNGHPTPRKIFDGRGTFSTSIRCSADGLWLAATYTDGFFRIWRMSFDGEPEFQPGSRHFPGTATDTSFNESASRIAVSTYDGFARLVELPTGTEIAQLGVPPPAGGQAVSAALAPRQPLLPLAQFQTTPTPNSLQIYDTNTLALVRPIDLVCDRVMFDPTGRRLVAVAIQPLRDDQAVLWSPGQRTARGAD